MNSEKFYDAMADKYSRCECADPRLASHHNLKVVAVDLDHPDVPRQSSRWIVYLGRCSRCKAKLTFGSRFGACGLVGVNAIKAAAEMQAGASINWSKIDKSVAAAAIGTTAYEDPHT